MAQCRCPRARPLAEHGRQHDAALARPAGHDAAHDERHHAHADQREDGEQRQVLLAEDEIRQPHPVPVGARPLHEPRDRGEDVHARPVQLETAVVNFRHCSIGRE